MRLVVCLLLTSIAGCVSTTDALPPAFTLHAGDYAIYELTVDGEPPVFAGHLFHADGDLLARQSFRPPPPANAIIPSGETVWFDRQGLLHGIVNEYDQAPAGASAWYANLAETPCAVEPVEFVLGEEQSLSCRLSSVAWNAAREPLDVDTRSLALEVSDVRTTKVDVLGTSMAAFEYTVTGLDQRGNAVLETESHQTFAPGACGVVAMERLGVTSRLAGYRCGDRSAGLTFDDVPEIEGAPLAMTPMDTLKGWPIKLTCQVREIGAGVDPARPYVQQDSCPVAAFFAKAEYESLRVSGAWSADPALVQAHLSVGAGGSSAAHATAGAQSPLELFVPRADVRADWAATLRFDGVTLAPDASITLEMIGLVGWN